jgi:hypothetical protein
MQRIPSIPQTTPQGKPQTVNDARITPRARRLYTYLKQHGPATPEQAMRALWGDAYLLVPWRNNFNQHLRMARRLAAEQGEAIVTVSAGYNRPLHVIEARHA